MIKILELYYFAMGTNKYPELLYCLNTNITVHIGQVGAKGDWDFRISGLVKNPDGTDI